ncbi:MAG: FtsK/SpoIIIE domain-containing protein [Solirubrobacteraceae bacterium]
MRVVLDNQDGQTADIELRLGREDATVSDLLDALSEAGETLGIEFGGVPGAGAPSGIVIDARFCRGELGLSEIGLYEGARIAPADGPGERPEPSPAALELRVVAGFDAGLRLPLHGEGLVVGRDDDCDLALGDIDRGVSRRHLQVTPGLGAARATVADLGSKNGTWVEGKRISEPTEVASGMVFEAGDFAFTIARFLPALPVDPVRQVNLAGTIAFNRPPRVRSGAAVEPLQVPEQPREGQKPRFSMASAIGPLILGVVMVLVLHSIIFALFMLLSPILVIGQWLEQRRHTGRASRGERREFEHKLEELRTEVARRHEQQLTRLREGFPDLAEIVRRTTAPDPRLWERRPGDDDFLSLMAGYGEIPFRPPVADRYSLSRETEAVLAEHGTLQLAPVAVELSKGGVVGIVGDRAPAMALARALLCQAVALHGPADLMTAVLTGVDGTQEWDWVKWLPHARDAGGAAGRLLAIGDGAGATLAAELSELDSEDPRELLVVLDNPALIEGRGAVGRALLRAGTGVSGIVLARSSERLPAACTAVVELADEAGETRLLRPQTGERIDPLLVAGVSEQTARECALALARFEDADLQLLGGALPDYVGLLGLAGLLEPDADGLRRRWASTESAGNLIARFALSEDGPLDIDLVADGPHGLVAGTTGAGKSELLRSLVASLAARYSPTRVNFVLVDYKGGSAFGECAQLPHTVGMVTDLDEQLGERALRSMEAELRHRERVLREHSASDLLEYDRLVGTGEAPSLPRLLVAIDEFATLATELPDFVASLVGIAQRGRSLGVHLLLATQRPSGAVSENIRANTNLRVCLRVQTPQDSSDVIDSPAAARIPRHQPGRAQVRLGPSELIPVQTALVTGTTPGGRAAAVAMAPFAAARTGANGTAPEAAQPESTDLVRLVRACGDAFADGPAPRRPWLQPLGRDVALDELLTLGPARALAGDRGLVVPFALADDPEAQAQYPVGWNLGAGNLLLYGIGGSGTTTALATLALALARLSEPTALHLYALDFGAGELSALGGLPHVGAVIGASEHERQRRLLMRLHGELRVRRGLDPSTRARAPRVIVLLDGYGGFASEHADAAGDALRDALARIWADGPELGIHTAIAADRLGAVPTALASLAQQRLAFALADAADYAQFGLPRRSVPRFFPGRAVVGGSSQVIQVGRPAGGLREAVAPLARERPQEGGPPPVGVLPESLGLDALLGVGAPAGGDAVELFLPVGIGDERLQPAGFELYDGDHAVVCGPPRSGRTTALLVLAGVVAARHPEVECSAIALRRSQLRDCPALGRVITSADELPELVGQLRASERMQLLLIDDADTVDDSSRALSELFAAPLPRVHAIVAGRPDALRSLGHWSVGVRRSRCGLLLMPDVSIDGQILGVTLPRRPVPPLRPGCGYRVDPGGFELIQVALAEPVGAAD